MNAAPPPASSCDLTDQDLQKIHQSFLSLRFFVEDTIVISGERDQVIIEDTMECMKREFEDLEKWVVRYMTEKLRIQRSGFEKMVKKIWRDTCMDEDGAGSDAASTDEMKPTSSVGR